MLTTISQPTRQAARVTVRNLKASGKVATILDRGNSFKGVDRWNVAVNALVKPSHKGKVIKANVTSDIGFDIRKVTTGVNGYDVFFDGQHLIRRDTRISAYQDALSMAHKAKLDVTTLKYK